MKKLAIAATVAAGLAVAVPVQAQAHDGFGLFGGLVAGAIIGSAVAGPYGYYGPGYGYYGPGYGYYGRSARVYYGPSYAREVVYVPRRIHRGYESFSYPVNYYYPTTSYYRGCCW
jgi:hypothetical protein